MQIHKYLFTALVLVALSSMSPRKAQAQFAVFDGASWAELGSIWGQDVSTGVKISQELAQGLKLYNNAVQIYGVASQEASYLRNKQILLAAGVLAQHAIIPGHPDWDKALTATGGIANAGVVWQRMIAPGGMNSFQAFNSRIALADSFGASTLNAIGSCNAAATQTDGSISSLEQMAIDLNPNANTRANQANLNNLSQTQQLRIQECQHNLQLQQAKMQALHTMAQRQHDQEILDMRTTDASVRSQITVSDTDQDILHLVDR